MGEMGEQLPVVIQCRVGQVRVLRVSRKWARKVVANLVPEYLEKPRRPRSMNIGGRIIGLPGAGVRFVLLLDPSHPLTPLGEGRRN